MYSNLLPIYYNDYPKKLVPVAFNYWHLNYMVISDAQVNIGSNLCLDILCIASILASVEY